MAANGAGNHEHDTCLVLDYGSQYTQLIARRIREKGVYSMLLPGDAEMVRFFFRERGRTCCCYCCCCVKELMQSTFLY